MDKERYNAIQRSLIRVPIQFLHVKGGFNPRRLIDTIKFKIQNYEDVPEYFKPCGTLLFCGSQGEGKTLSAVHYIRDICKTYPYCILVSNTRVRGRPFNAYVKFNNVSDDELRVRYEEVKIERKKEFYRQSVSELKEEFYDLEYPTVTVDKYVEAMLPFYYFDVSDDYEKFCQEQQFELRDILTDKLITTDKILDGTFKNVTVQYTGLDCLKYVNNNKAGVIFFIDEIHLELNSLESKNIPIEVMVEISQQRKQRKHIVGTSQRYIRCAKPLREQVRDIVACKCYLGCIQYNQLIDGDSTHEVNGELAYDVRRRFIFFHSPVMYKSYDTYAKMKRYNNEWHGRPQVVSLGGIQNE